MEGRYRYMSRKQTLNKSERTKPTDWCIFCNQYYDVERIHAPVAVRVACSKRMDAMTMVLLLLLTRATRSQPILIC